MASTQNLLEELYRRRTAAKSCVPHDPTDKQRAFLSLTCLEALYGGAAGGGKSDALLMSFFGDDKDPMRYVQTPGYAGLILRRTYADLSLPGAIMDRAHAWLAGSGAHWDDKTKTWTFSSTATLTFGYLDAARDHFRYQGAEFQWVGFDELTQFLEAQYLYLFSRLRRLKAAEKLPIRMRAATNPGGIGHEWVKTRFIDAPGQRIFIPATLDDNPHLDREAYEESLAQLDAITRAQLRSGSWVRDSSMLVYRFDAKRNTAPDLPPLAAADRWRFILGIDYGNVDATAFCVLAFCRHEPCVYVVESQAWEQLTPSDAADMLKEWQERYGGFERIVADVGGLGKGYAEEAKKRYRLPIRPAQKSDKLGFIKLANGDLEGGRVRLLPANKALAAELSALAWKDRWQDAEHPELPNHLCDAFLYAWREARHWRAEAKPPEKPKPGTREALDARAQEMLNARRLRLEREEREEREAEADANPWGDDRNPFSEF